MSFDFNLYSTPLLFGWVQGILFAVLFFMRAWRTERLSDWLFGGLMIALTFEIWEYMLGFAGIEILWKELDFFPRGFGLLLPPMVWFYLRSLINDQFAFSRRDLWHALPFLINTSYHLVVFAMGSTFVQYWNETVHYPYQISIVVVIFGWVQSLWYLANSYGLYRDYLRWTPTQFSDIQQVSFTWFLNFLIAMFALVVVSMVMSIVDWSFKLDFWNDWWDELFKAAIIYYLGIAAWAQTVPGPMRYAPALTETPARETEQIEAKTEKFDESELPMWKQRIEKLMDEEKLWLNPELTMTDLAKRLHTNASVLSGVVNTAFGKNFNDFVNAYRVAAVQDIMREGKADHLSLLGIGMECGFNSKSTFNRAFKKATGLAPSQWQAY
jgi:AraC-like DNA-binding protein